MQRNMKAVVAIIAACLLAAAPAAAHATITSETPAQCVPSDAVPAYTEVIPDVEHPAVGEPTITVDNPDYVPAVEEESHVEHEFVHKKEDHPNSPRWEREGWNADDNENSKGWFSTGNTRVVVDVPGSDAVGEPTIVIDNPEYVPAWTEVVPDIEHPAVPAVTCEQEPEVVAPVACATLGGWYTERDDNAPVATEAGLVFTGGSGKAVGLRVPTTGNLQGWTTVSFNAIGGTEQFFFRIVIDASADGGPAYKSLSFPGTSTITQDSVSYQFGESIAATAVRFPNAVITSVGFQTNSGAPEGFEAVLSSMTGGCGDVDWTWAPLPEGYSVPSEWFASEYDCDDTSYVETRVVDHHAFARGEGGAVVETVTQVTEERTVEREADCPIVEPEPEPTVEPTPTQTPAPAAAPAAADGLAVTGGPDLRPLMFGGALALLAGIAALIVVGIRRANQ